MVLHIIGKVGDDGFAERLAATLDGRPCIVRWTPPSGSAADVDFARRVRDAGAYLLAHPHPLLPVVHAVTEVADGPLVVGDASEGVPLRAMAPARVPEAGFLSYIEQVADWLHQAYEARDARSRVPTHFLHRSLSLDTLRLRSDGRPLITGFDALRVDVERTARTSLVRPGLRSAPEHPTHTPRSDTWMLAAAAYQWIAPFRGLSTRLADLDRRSGADYDDAWGRLVHHLDVPLSPGTRAILARCLRFDPAQRPTPGELANLAQAAGANASVLASWASTTVPAPAPVVIESHELAGRVIDLAGGSAASDVTRFEPAPISTPSVPTPAKPTPPSAPAPFAGFSVPAATTFRRLDHNRRDRWMLVLGLVAFAVLASTCGAVALWVG